MSTGEKLPYADVYPVAAHIAEAIRPYCDRVEIAGSLRRKRHIIGDIEIVALPKRAKNLFGEPTGGMTELDVFLALKGLQMIKDGDKYKQFVYGRFSVDLFLPESAAHWGAIYTIRTGSHDFNLWIMQQRCKQAGVKFVDGRITHYRHGLLDTPEESDVFEALNMDYAPPEERDDRRWLAYIKETTP